MESLKKFTSFFDEANARFGNVVSRYESGVNLRQRFFNSNNLDITYVSEQIIAMGGLHDGPTNKAKNLNNIYDVAAHLNQIHSGNYLLMNLSDDISKLTENLGVFYQQVVDFSWDRAGIKTHTPPLEHAFRICYAIQAWCTLNSENVAVIFCDNGKTRTGVIIACYWMLTRLCDSPLQAFTLFYQKRMSLPRLTSLTLKQRTPPSILQFLNNFYNILENQCIPNENPLLMKRLVICRLPVATQPILQIWDDEQQVYPSDHQANIPSAVDWDADNGCLCIAWDKGVCLDGDFCILCSAGDDSSVDTNEAEDSSRMLFRYAHSTYFFSMGSVGLNILNVDVMKQKISYFDADFSVEFVFYDTSEPCKRILDLHLTGNAAIKQGIIEITKQHMVVPDAGISANLVKMGYKQTGVIFALQRSQNIPNAALDLLSYCQIIPTLFSTDNEHLLPQNHSKKEDLKDSSHATLVNHYPYLEASAPLDIELCGMCKIDDFLLRSQLIECITCHKSFHTKCVNEKKIPFGLTTQNDKTNRAAYISKKFSTWSCLTCRPIASSSPKNLQEKLSSQDCSATAVQSLYKATNSISHDKAEHNNLEKSSSERNQLSHELKMQQISDKSINSFIDSTAEDKLVKKTSKFNEIQTLGSDLSAHDISELEQMQQLLKENGFTMHDLIEFIEEKAKKEEKQSDLNDLCTALSAHFLDHTPSAIDNKGYMNNLTKNINTSIQKIREKGDKMKKNEQERSASCEGLTNLENMIEAVERIEEKIEIKVDKSKLIEGAVTIHSNIKNDFSEVLKVADVPSVNDKQADNSYKLNDSLEQKENQIEIKDVVKKEEIKEVNDLKKGAIKDMTYVTKDSETLGKSIKIAKKGVSMDDSLTLLHKENTIVDGAITNPPIENNDISSEQIPLKDDPKYCVYFKMLKMGLARAAVENKMKRDDVDIGILNFDPNLPMPPQILLKAHPHYAKYFKMLAIGLPKDAVKHNMMKDKMNPNVLDLNPEKPLPPDFENLKEPTASPDLSAVTLRARKKLHWQPITVEDGESSIWSSVLDVQNVKMEMDMAEFESLFFASNDNKVTKEKEKEPSKPLHRRMKSCISLVDMKRATNVAIFLSRINLSFEEIGEAISSFDAKGLSNDRVIALREFLPTLDEIKTVTSYQGNKDILGEAERFFLHMATISRCSQRLECLVYKQLYSNRSVELRKRIQTLQNACQDVRMSDYLKLLLAVVLKLGNQLNHDGKTQGEIKGFTLDSLLQLSQTKAYNQKTTILQYLVRLIQRNQPEVLDFKEQLTHIFPASRDSNQLIRADHKQLHVDFNILLEEQALAKGQATPYDDFISFASNDLTLLDQEIKQMENEVEGVLTYFGENAEMKTQDFFTTLCTFCSAFDQARKDMEREDLYEKKLQAKKQEELNRSAMRRTQSMRVEGSKANNHEKHPLKFKGPEHNDGQDNKETAKEQS